MINDKLIEIKSLDSGVNYAINLQNVIYYEVGVYDRDDPDDKGRVKYYAEFFFGNNRRLKFIRDFDFGGTQDDFKNAIRYNTGEILVTKEI